MSTSVVPFCPPVTPRLGALALSSAAAAVVPRYRPVGDDWVFLLSFVGMDGVTPYDLTNAAPSADLFLAQSATALPRMGVGTGITIFGDAADGNAVLIVPRASTEQAPPQDPGMAQIYATRIVIGLTEQGLFRSVAPIFVCPFLTRMAQPWPVDDETVIKIAVRALPSVPVSISGTPPSSAVVGAAYEFTPAIANGTGAKTFALSGTLPAGLTFSTSTGEIAGTPTAAGTAAGLNITVTDSAGSASLGAFSIAVSAIDPITGTELIHNL